MKRTVTGRKDKRSVLLNAIFVGLVFVIALTFISFSIPVANADPSCSVTVSNGMNLESLSHDLATSIDTVSLSALIMQPGATASICVTYQLSGAAAVGQAPPTGTIVQSAVSFSASVYSVTATPVTNDSTDVGGTMYSYLPALGVMTSSTPSSLTIDPSSQGKILVMYTITTSSNSAGFYDISFTNNCPALIPLAVVGAPASLSAGNFPGFFHEFNCRMMQPLSLGIITGYSGMNFTLLSSSAGR